MRIAFFTDVYHPTINGVVTSIDSYVDELRKLGHEVTIICPKYDDERHSEEKDVVRIKSFTFKRYDEYRIALPFSLALESHMRNTVYDIIHVHSPFSIGLAGVAYGHRYKVPIIYTAHTNYSDYRHYVRGGWVIPEGAVHKAVSIFTNRLSATIAPSQKIAKLLQDYGTYRRVVVLPTGVKESRLSGSRSTFKQRYQLGRHRVALYLGRITKEKRIEFLITAFATAKKRGLENTRLVLVGDGPYADTLKKLAYELGVVDDIVFTGFLSGQDLADAYAAADIFCHASLSETQGMTLLEASAYGVPLLICRDGAYDGVARNGYNACVVSGGELAYANRLVDLLSDNSREKLQSMGRNGRSIAQGLTMSRQAEKLVQLYKEVICEHRTRVTHEK